MHVEEELKTYLQVLWRYKWMIAACAIISSLVALGISLLLTPKYSAKATVRVASAAVGSSDYTYYASATRLSNTFVEIATSDITLDEVARRLGLPKQPKVEVEIIPETELIEISTSDPDPARAQDIANTLASLMVEQSEQFYGGSAPTARQILEEQLNQAKIDLETAISEYDNALRSQSTSTTPANGTPIPNPDAESLARLVSVRQQIYTDLIQRYEAARTSEQLRANAITIVEPAGLALRPSTPKIPLNIALGLIAGLATGVILAFLFEGMDDTLRSTEDIQAITPLPILCLVPQLKSDGKFLLDDNPVAPAFDQLRAHLMLLGAKQKSTTYLFTSPEPGAGKSTISANLAVSLSQGVTKVVLVDMDFHRPRQHAIMGLPNDMGLCNYMCSEIQLEAILQKTSHPNLRVITAGSNPHSMSEWLTPEKIGNLLDTLSKVFDFVLIDSPALLSVADPFVMASRADATILVVARRKTERKNLRFALKQLSEFKVKVVGIVVNRVPNSQLYTYYSRTKTERGSRSHEVKPQIE